MSNLTLFEAGPLSDWAQWAFTHPSIGKPAPGKLFLAEKLGLTGMEVSLNTLPAGRGLPFFHRHHHHEELYLILAGEGEFLVDGERIPVREGSSLRISPAGVRSWRNTGPGPLLYIVIQAVEGSLSRYDIADGEILEEKVVW